VLVFADLTKLDLLGYAAAQVTGGPADRRIQHYRVHSAEISTTPPLPVLADGFLLGEGPLHIGLMRRALAMMAGNKVATHLIQPETGMVGM
jgi:diacylglycerol kinase family enzyme